MKNAFTSSQWRTLLPCAFILLALLGGIAHGAPLGATFNYQGRLIDGVKPPTDNYDFVFSLFDAATFGALVGTPTTIARTVGVTNGMFTVELDFGSATFAGDARWLQIEVRKSGTGVSPTTLTPRQLLTLTPYAVYAKSAGIQNATLTADKFASGQVVKSLNGLKDDVTLLEGANVALGPNPLDHTITIGVRAVWKLDGNSGTTAGTHFLGTVDNQPLELRVFGNRVLRLEPNDPSPNVIGGSEFNSASPGVYGGTVSGGGGYDSGPFGLLRGNIVSDHYGTIGGGRDNHAGNGGMPDDAKFATVGGGSENSARGAFSTVGGGTKNRATTYSATVGGGEANTALGDWATVGGGNGNTSSGASATVGGGSRNTSSGGAATVGGGQFNEASGSTATVGGGAENTASGLGATVGGGSGNTSSDGFDTVGGGSGNTSSGIVATVGGGVLNAASGYEATVGGGSRNTSSGGAATVGGGARNTASGYDATVPGGRGNTAGGNSSLAAGCRAQALHDGTFIWADSQYADFASNIPDKVRFRCRGGFDIITGTDAAGNPTSAAYLDPGDSSWNVLSDREKKENFQAVDPREVLAKVAAMPVSRWNYKSNPGREHVGPMAQDFHAAFGLGADDKSIATVDADGVALAAIQGLHLMVKEKEAEIQALQKRVLELEKKNEGREAPLTRLEKALESRSEAQTANLKTGGNQ